MKKIIKLSEQDLIFIVKKVIDEQTREIKKPENINFGYRTAPSDATQVVSKIPSGEKQQVNPVSKTDIDIYEGIIPPAIWDNPDFMGGISLVTALAGLVLSFTPAAPVGAALFGISTITAVREGSILIEQGDPYWGWMLIVLSIIPGGEFARMTGLKKGTTYFINLIKKYRSGVKLTKAEVEELKFVGASFNHEAKLIKELTRQSLKKSIRAFLQSKSIQYLAEYSKKVNILRIPEISIKIGGTAYAFDQIYLFIFRKIYYDEKKLNSRQQNKYRLLIRKLLGHEDEIKKQLLENATEQGTEYAQTYAKPLEMDTTKMGYLLTSLDSLESIK